MRTSCMMSHWVLWWKSPILKTKQRSVASSEYPAPTTLNRKMLLITVWKSFLSLKYFWNSRAQFLAFVSKWIFSVIFKTKKNVQKLPYFESSPQNHNAVTLVRSTMQCKQNAKRASGLLLLVAWFFALKITFERHKLRIFKTH